jgi:hypothetical protein
MGLRATGVEASRLNGWGLRAKRSISCVIVAMEASMRNRNHFLLKDVPQRTQAECLKVLATESCRTFYHSSQRLQRLKGIYSSLILFVAMQGVSSLSFFMAILGVSGGCMAF